MQIGIHVEYLFHCNILRKLDIPKHIFEKILKYQNFMKILLVETELYHAEERTEK